MIHGEYHGISVQGDQWYIIYISYGCFLKWRYPQNTPKWSFLVGKPMVVGYHHFRKPPYIYKYIYIYILYYVHIWYMNQICLWRHFCRHVHTSVPGKEMIEIVSLKATYLMFEDQWSTVKYIKLFQRRVIPVTNLQKLQKKFGSIFFLCSISIRIWLTIKSAWLLVVLVSAGQMLKSPQQSFDKKNKTAYHWRKEETGNTVQVSSNFDTTPYLNKSEAIENQQPWNNMWCNK